MDIKFLKEMINDEMENAKEYAAEAVKEKVSHPKWARTLMDMSERTQKHVETLHEMLKECHDEELKNPGMQSSYSSQSDYDSDYKELIDDYADKVSKMKSMRDMYYRR